jgi:hypothetical protein
MNAEVQELNDELFGSGVVKSSSEVLSDSSAAKPKAGVDLNKYAALADELNAELGMGGDAPVFVNNGDAPDTGTVETTTKGHGKSKLEQTRGQWKKRMQAGLSGPSRSKHLNRPVEYHEQSSSDETDFADEMNAKLGMDGQPIPAIGKEPDKYAAFGDTESFLGSAVADFEAETSSQNGLKVPHEFSMVMEEASRKHSALDSEPGSATLAGRFGKSREDRPLAKNSETSSGSQQLLNILLEGLGPTLSKVGDLVAAQDERINREVGLREEVERELVQLRALNEKLKRQ